MGEYVVHGENAGTPVPITEVDDGAVKRLAVDAKLTAGFVAEVNLDKAADEVLIYGTTTAAEATGNPADSTRLGIHVDANGNQVAVGAAADAAAVTGNPVLIAGTDGTNVHTLRLIANDAVDAGNPLKTGGKANTLAAPPTAVAAADRVDSYMDLRGRRVVAPYVNVTYGTPTSVSITTDAVIVGASASRIGLKLTHTSGTGDLFVRYDGGTVTATVYHDRIQPGESVTIPPWAVPTVAIRGLSSSGTVVVAASEITAQ